MNNISAHDSVGLGQITTDSGHNKSRQLYGRGTDGGGGVTSKQASSRQVLQSSTGYFTRYRGGSGSPSGSSSLGGAGAGAGAAGMGQHQLHPTTYNSNGSMSCKGGLKQ